MGLLGITNLPVGFVFPVINSNIVPVGSFECDGSAISKTTYANLFSGGQLSIGTLYGDGGATFYLPDFRGRGPRGWDHGAGRDPDAASRFADIGGITGNNVGSMQDDMYESHVHSITTYQELAGGPYVNNAQGPTIIGSPNTNASGGTETRMKNFNVMWCIKY